MLQRTIYVLNQTGDEFRHVAVGVFAGPDDMVEPFREVCSSTYDIGVRRAPVTQPFAFGKDVKAIVGGLLRIIADENVVLIHGQTHDNDLLATLLGHLRHLPAVATHQGARLYPDNRVAPSLRRRLRTVVLRWVLQSLDAVIAVGPDVKANILAVARIPEERIFMMRNSVFRAEAATPEEQREARLSFNLPLEQPVVAVVGRLIPAKGVDTAIEAIGLLAAADNCPVLVIAGDGPDRQRLEEIAAGIEHGTDNVRFLGLTRRVPELLHAADIFLSASHSEGTSMALLEAMARRLPAVVADAPGLRDSVTDGRNGRLFQLRESADCARVIAEVLAAPKRAQEMAVLAQEEVRRDFSIEALAEAHRDLYLRLLNSRNLS
jgi:glycosyltransferase involved in cell wall biosynthesis